MQHINSRIVAGMICLVLTTRLFAIDPEAPVLKAFKFVETPSIDGVMDEMWEALPWYSLNNVWMNWEATVDSADYFGHFKIAWSEQNNLLYFFVEITDDVLVERYAEIGDTPYFNDILEVFLDEDGSGGMHLFDGAPDAENAFSYHITPLEYPGSEKPATSFIVIDRDGTGWSDSQSMDYVDHFQELVLHKNGDKYVWEFSLTVFTDAYEYSAPEGTESNLEIGKEMGLALAYCETDLLDDYRREMFLGSFPGNPDKLGNADNKYLYGYNDTWKNADDYSLLILEDVIGLNYNRPFLEGTEIEYQILKDEVSNQIWIVLDSESHGEISVELFDLNGRLLRKTEHYKSSGRWECRLESLGREQMCITRIQHAGQTYRVLTPMR